MSKNTTIKPADVLTNKPGYREFIDRDKLQQLSHAERVALVYIKPGDPGKMGAIPSIGFTAGEGLTRIKSSGLYMSNIPGTCGDACKGCGCDKFCYALRDQRQYKNTNIRAAINTAILDIDPLAIYDAVNEFCRGKWYRDPAHKRYFRLLQSGELRDMDMLDLFQRIAYANHTINFYGYSKRVDIIEERRQAAYMGNWDGDACPAHWQNENLTWTASQWNDALEIPAHYAQFVYDDGTDPAVMALPHCKGGHGKTCETCLWCATHKGFDKMAVSKH